MIIDTRTKERMIASLASYFDITEDELFQYIDYAASKAQPEKWGFDANIFEVELLSIFSDLQPEEKIDEIYVYHLTRRLNDAMDDKSCLNLRELLINETSFSRFLKKYKVSFIERDYHLIIIFDNAEIHLDSTLSDDAYYLRRRLGYNVEITDYCFNGFALRDQLMRNMYTRQLYNGPEFLDVLFRYLPISGIKKSYFENSKYFCYTYKLSIDEIMFDDRHKLSNEEKIDYFIVQVCMRILGYLEDNNFQSDHDNPIIRISDDVCVLEDKIINVEEITFDMIK